MIRLYNQNIWGNMPKTEKVANRNRLVYTLIQEYKPDFCTFQECNPKTSRQGEDAMQEILKDSYAEAAPETIDCHTCHAYPVRNEQDIYVGNALPTVTIDYIMTYGENPLQAKAFRVLTDERALSSSDHCPLVGDFVF